MNKAIRIIQSYLFFTLPLLIICMVWSSLQAQSGALDSDSVFLKVLWGALSWNLILWFATLIIFLMILVAFPTARERTLRRLANLHDRDEREEIITGKASRVAYVSTLSLLIFLLFVSIFTVNITRLPESQAVDGHHHALSIGFHGGLFDKPLVEKDSQGDVLFESKDVPLSKTAIILIVLIWQLLSYNLSARKELRVLSE